MFTYTANNDSFGRLRSSVDHKAELGERKVAGTIPVVGINPNYLTRHHLWFGRPAQVFVSQRHIPETKMK